MEGFTALLQVALIVLKLVGVITWSWWIVLLPALISVVGLIFFVVVGFIIFLVASRR